MESTKSHRGMDSSTYRHLMGQLNKNCIIPHYNFPSHNLTSVENLNELSQNASCDEFEDSPDFLGSFPCYQPFPYIAGKNSVLFCGSREIDDATKFLKRKMHWERKLKDLRVPNIESAIKSIKKLRKNKSVKLPEDLKNYIDHFQSDPEPMFTGNYNWLYTGGCLAFDCNSDGVILISADYWNKHSGFNILGLNDTLTDAKVKSFTQLKANSPVCQITCKKKNENLMICVRQKHQLCVYRTSKSEEHCHPVRMWRKKVLAGKLLTCVDIKPDSEELILTDSSHDAHVFNMERKEKVSGYSGKKIARDGDRNAWSQVAYGDFGVYWAFKNCFTVLDERGFDSKTALEYNPTTAGNSCEEICSFTQSHCDSNYIYLATSHNVLQLDLRMGRAVQRWTHLMKNPPQYITNIKDEEGNEVLLLQSHVVDEVVGIVNEYKVNDGKSCFYSKSLPCLMKSVKESLKLARFHGTCLHPFVTKKLNFYVTGVRCLKSSENDIILLTKNSGGDIFKTTIKKKDSGEFLKEEEDQEILNSMKVYGSHCEKISPRNPITKEFQLVDMSHMLKDINKPAVKPPKRGELGEYWKYHEMHAPESLIFYKDVLASKILKVWGHCPDMPEPEDEDMSVDTKVREWMDRC